MEIVKRLVDGEFEGAEEFDDAAIVGAEAFFEIIDAVVGIGFVGKSVNTIKIINFVFMFSGVFNHVPLDGVLSVEFFHVFLIAAGKKIDCFVAVEHEHGGREWYSIN